MDERRDRNPDTGENIYIKPGARFGDIFAKLTGKTARKLATKSAEKVAEKTGEVLGEKIYDKFSSRKKKETTQPQ